ncbi:hypothetical protein LX32DRAFT_658879 [Colletotrichum zoysiae]|uniref:Uncharacterized protein n=1 Tax=Colletotrichum zoysiae TaxID=1216348 RepID=A0AAD9H1K7_9PEZI|nr:hypothetical protein LX32DRAFT_658879 [Colletotrichum zoysiae]
MTAEDDRMDSAHHHSLFGDPHEFHGQSVRGEHLNVMPQPLCFVKERGIPGATTMYTNILLVWSEEEERGAKHLEHRDNTKPALYMCQQCSSGVYAIWRLRLQLATSKQAHPCYKRDRPAVCDPIGTQRAQEPTHNHNTQRYLAGNKCPQIGATLSSDETTGESPRSSACQELQGNSVQFDTKDYDDSGYYSGRAYHPSNDNARRNENATRHNATRQNATKNDAMPKKRSRTNDFERLLPALSQPLFFLEDAGSTESSDSLEERLLPDLSQTPFLEDARSTKSSDNLDERNKIAPSAKHSTK